MWSWKESVCVTTLLIVLIPAVLSVLYGDVLLYLWLLCLCLGCTGDILLGSMANSLLLYSMGISPLSMGFSLGCWVLISSMVDSPLLHSMGDFSSVFHGCLPGLLVVTGLSVHWLLGSVLLLGLDLSVVQVLIIMSLSPCLWLIYFLKWKLKHLLVPCYNLLFLALI